MSDQPTEHQQRHVPGHKHLYCDESCWAAPQPTTMDWERELYNCAHWLQKEYPGAYSNVVSLIKQVEAETRKDEQKRIGAWLIEMEPKVSDWRTLADHLLTGQEL